MPLRTLKCRTCATPIDYLEPKEAAPTMCACGGDLVPALPATAPGRVIGSTTPLRIATGNRDGFTTIAESETMAIRVKGNSLTRADYECDSGHKWGDDYDGDPPEHPNCPTCGLPSHKIIVQTAATDWFKEACGGDPRGYFDNGLGAWVTSREHRARLMRERGLQEGTNDYAHSRYDMEEKARIDRENAEVESMLNECDSDPAMKKARDQGLVPDWDWARAALREQR